MDLVDNIYDLFKKSNGVSTDTRQNLEGKLFFALKGKRFDGNIFARNALKNGAKYAVIDNPEYRINKNCVLVDNSLDILQKLAKKFRT